MQKPDGTVWTALQVLTGTELDVLRRISAELPEVRAIAPTEELAQLRARRSRIVQKPLLPGYVLVAWQQDARLYYRIRGVHGVIRFLGGGSPAVIPDDQMRIWIALDRHCKSGRPAPAVRVGGQTRIIGGPLADTPVTGVNKRAGRASLEVQLADQRHTVTVAVAIDKTET